MKRIMIIARKRGLILTEVEVRVRRLLDYLRLCLIVRAFSRWA